MKIASFIGFAIAVAALVGLLYRHALLATGIPAIAVQVLAAVLMIWARITFGSRSFHAGADPLEGGLVTSGPYAFLRHPIYAAIIYVVWAGALTHLSTLHVLLAVLVTAGLSVRMFAEERLVVERYPEYTAYAARTKRIVPFVL